MVRHERTLVIVSMVLSSLAAVTIGGCSRAESPAPAGGRTGPPVVYVVNEPLRFFTEFIADGAVDVRLPAPADEDPAFWRPDADHIAAYQSADLILLNGAAYAKWLALASLPASRMVDTSVSFRDAFIHVEGSGTHSHGLTGEHSHAGTAFTTWLDFRQAILQAAAVRDALSSLIPGREQVFAARFAELEVRLGDLDERMTAIAETHEDTALVASHPVYQYWARRYGLDVESVTWEPDVVPDEASMSGLQRLLAGHPASIMIWEGPPDPRSLQSLEAIGVTGAVFDPCSNTPGEGDFLSVMEANLANLQRAFAEVGG